MLAKQQLASHLGEVLTTFQQPHWVRGLALKPRSHLRMAKVPCERKSSPSVLRHYGG